MDRGPAYQAIQIEVLQIIDLSARDYYKEENGDRQTSREHWSATEDDVENSAEYFATDTQPATRLWPQLWGKRGEEVCGSA